jgi:hypothetical protein
VVQGKKLRSDGAANPLKQSGSADELAEMMLRSAKRDSLD